MESYLFFLGILGVTAFNVACTNHAGAPIIPKYRVHRVGDPLGVVRGAKLERQIDIFANHEEMGGFYLYEADTFTSLELVPTRQRPSDGRSGNEASSEIVEEVHGDYQAHLSADGDFVYASTGANELRFEFSKSDANEVIVTDPRARETNIGKILHSSWKADRSAFSLMVHFKGMDRKLNKRGDLVTSYFFVKRMTDPLPPERVDARFLYLGGPGAVNRWPQGSVLKIRFCGSVVNSPWLKAFREGVEMWKPFLNDRLEIETELVSEEFPPYADLNSNCFYLLDDYTSVDSIAFAIPILNTQRNEIIDADTFFFSRGTFLENNKLSNSKKLRWLKAISAHEIGHVLGLDHAFTLQNRQGEVSIMNYNDTETITQYDRLAIQALYPLFD